MAVSYEYFARGQFGLYSPSRAERERHSGSKVVDRTGCKARNRMRSLLTYDLQPWIWRVASPEITEQAQAACLVSLGGLGWPDNCIIWLIPHEIACVGGWYYALPRIGRPNDTTFPRFEVCR